MEYRECGHLLEDHPMKDGKITCRVAWPGKCKCEKFKADQDGFFGTYKT